MKTTIVLILALLVGQTATMQAQGEPTDPQHIAVRLDPNTGKIDLFNRQLNAVITQDYQLSKLELTIFDANGEYAGTLNLQELKLPQDEVDASEQVKVALMKLLHTNSGKELTLANVDLES